MVVCKLIQESCFSIAKKMAILILLSGLPIRTTLRVEITTRFKEPVYLITFMLQMDSTILDFKHFLLNKYGRKIKKVFLYYTFLNFRPESRRILDQQKHRDCNTKKFS